MPPVREQGFTLVEMIITMMVITVAVLSLSQTLGFAFRHQSDGIFQARSVALAGAYFEEILARRYDESTPLGGVPPCAPATIVCSAVGPDAGEIRATFDDADDYHGLDELPPQDVDGNPLADYAGYRVQVDVAYLTAAQITALGLDDVTDAKRIRVSVTPPGGSALEFAVVRGNF